MSTNRFKMEDLKDFKAINKFKSIQSTFDESEEFRLNVIIKQEKEEEMSGNYRYDSMDKSTIQKYVLRDEVKKENRRVSTEIDIYTSPANAIGEFDKKEKRIFDYTGYKLMIRKADYDSKEILKYIFNAFREFYGKDTNRNFSLCTTRHDRFIQLDVDFVCWYALEGFNGIDEKMNEVKSEIESILNIFEIYNYHVILKLLE